MFTYFPKILPRISQWLFLYGNSFLLSETHFARIVGANLVPHKGYPMGPEAPSEPAPNPWPNLK